MAELEKKEQEAAICDLWETHFKCKNANRLKEKNRKRYNMQTLIQKKQQWAY